MVSLDNTGPTTGKGAFFYIGAVTINEYNNPILGKPPDELTRKVSLNFQIETGDRVIVTDDGFICLFNNSDEQVVYILNTIFASARLFWGIPLDIVRIGELCNFEWIQTSNLIRIVGFAYVERNMFSLQRDKNGETFEEWQIVTRKVVNQDEMAKIIHFAYWILQNKDLHIDLILLFDGFTLLNRGAYTASFLYGWMMIETFLNKIWKEHVDSLSRANREKQALKDHNRWTTYHHIEVLSAINKMPEAVRDIFNQLRRRRNEIVHERKEIDLIDAHYCLNISDRILRNRINTPNDPFLDIDKIPR